MAILSIIASPLSKYVLSDFVDATVTYLGYQDKDGNWYIQQIDTSTSPSTARYFAGTSNYATNWSNRASLSYDYFSNIF